MRALLIVLDSVGVGGAPDAAKYGDRGADTLGHIFAHLGLGEILAGRVDGGGNKEIKASYGRMREQSAGKDTTTGHWEMAGAVLDEPFAVFEKFPARLVEAIEAEAKVQFIGNHPASGTTVLEELGAEHCRTQKPILYTSADSVMQIAVHGEVVSLKRLYEICRIARRHCNAYRIGRVIARPFVGTSGAFRRTAGRHDYSIVPPRTVLNAISESGFVVQGVGKIGDIYAQSGVTHSHSTKSNEDGMKQIERLWQATHDGLVFANLVDFDSLHGHRRDVEGYAQALVAFDHWLRGFLPAIEGEDLFIITADHGNDPTFRGTDHTREEVPLIIKYDGRVGPVGVRESFADVAATLASFFKLKESWPVGKPILDFHSKTTRHLRAKK
jgi:phosphopentomutase